MKENFNRMERAYELWGRVRRKRYLFKFLLTVQDDPKKHDEVEYVDKKDREAGRISKWVIMPENKYKNLWDLVANIGLLFSFFLTSFVIAFDVAYL